MTQVLIKVEYVGQWSCGYSDNSGSSTWSGTGTKTLTLNRPGNADVWTISATAIKNDFSANTLRIMIMKTDGTILREGSTSTPYGATQVTYTIRD